MAALPADPQPAPRLGPSRRAQTRGRHGPLSPGRTSYSSAQWFTNPRCSVPRLLSRTVPPQTGSWPGVAGATAVAMLLGRQVPRGSTATFAQPAHLSGRGAWFAFPRRRATAAPRLRGALRPRSRASPSVFTPPFAPCPATPKGAPSGASPAHGARPTAPPRSAGTLEAAHVCADASGVRGARHRPRASHIASQRCAVRAGSSAPAAGLESSSPATFGATRRDNVFFGRGVCRAGFYVCLLIVFSFWDGSGRYYVMEICCQIISTIRSHGTLCWCRNS